MTNATDCPRIDVAGIPVAGIGRDALVATLANLAAGPGQSTVGYLNAHVFNLAWQDVSFRETLGRLSIIWPDGVSGRLACARAGVRLPQRVCATWFFDDLCERLARLGVRQFLLGGSDSVVAAAAERISVKWPGLVADVHGGYFATTDEAAVVDRINGSGANVVTVGMGSPRQEQWIVRNAERLRPRLVWAVGALFDVLAGVERGAPRWMQRSGLEWAWRLGQDFQGKWRRYLLGNPLFLWRLACCRPRSVARHGAPGV